MEMSEMAMLITSKVAPFVMERVKLIFMMEKMMLVFAKKTTSLLGMVEMILLVMVSEMSLPVMSIVVLLAKMRWMVLLIATTMSFPGMTKMRVMLALVGRADLITWN